MATSKAQRRAQKTYDAKRHKGVLIRFDAAELRKLDSQLKKDESRPSLIKRLLGFAP